MSIARCDKCSRQVDTDEDVYCYDSEGQCFCEPCRDAWLEEGRAMAAEYQREVIQPQLDRQDVIDAGRGHLIRDEQFCGDEDGDAMCSECACWKQTRAYCS